MNWFGLRSGLFAVLSAALVGPAVAAAPSDALLPAETKSCLIVANFPAALAAWEKTSLGRLLQDPAMKAFSEHLDQQVNSESSRPKSRLGVNWNDVKALATGEVAWSYVHLDKDKPAAALLMNIKGKSDDAKAVLAKITKSLTGAGYKSRTVEPKKGLSLTVFDPPAAAANAKEVRTPKVYFLHEDLFCAAESLAVATRLAAAVGGSPGSVLNQVPAYQGIMERCAKDAGDDQPEARWFMEPFGWTAARRIEDPSLISKKKPDPFEVYKKEGFTAMQGVGGFVHLGDNGYDLTHRTMVFAPKPYQRSMQMVELPNTSPAELAVPSWVTQDLASCTVSSINMLNAFDHYGTFFEQMFADGDPGVWKETLLAWAKDDKGPKVDARKDIIEKLKDRMVQLFAFHSPITPTSEREIAAFEAKPGAAVDKPVYKLLENDDTAKQIAIGQTPAYEVYKDDQKVPPPQRVVCAHPDTLFSTSHADVLAPLLAPAGAQPLTQLAAFKAVTAELQKLNLSQISVFQFGQTDKQIVGYYELFRAGQLDKLESRTSFGRMLQRAAVKNAGQGLDGKKLPEFSAVQKYFGPNGTLGVSEDKGWFFKGMFLPGEK